MTDTPLPALPLDAIRDRAAAFRFATTSGALEADVNTLAMASATDVPDLLEHVGELLRLLLTDPLTGVGSRRAAYTMWDRHGEDITAVMILDVNRFKHVNDSLGHATGDRVLARIAAHLAMVIGDQGEVYRLGGDEFAVFMTGLPGGLHRCARLTARAIRSVYTPGVAVGAVSTFGPVRADLPTVLAAADAAQYRAKEDPERDWAVYAPDLDSGRSDPDPGAVPRRAVRDNGHVPAIPSPEAADDFWFRNGATA